MFRFTSLILVGAIVAAPVVMAQAPAAAPSEPRTGGLLALPPPGPRAGGAAGSAEPAPGAPPAEPGAPSPAGDAAAPGALVPPPPVELPPGDTITLKSGKVLRNVQVLKTTLTEVHVQTLYNASADLPPLIVPRQYIESIEYDDYDPNMAALQKGAAQRAPGLMSGFEVSKDMSDKLNTKIEPPLDFENRDVIEVLRDVGKQMGVTIEIGEDVKAMAREARLWTFRPGDDVTLSLLLQEKLPEKFPELAAEYEFDHIIVKRKPTETSVAAPDPASGATPPPAPGPASEATPPPAPAAAPSAAPES